MTQIYVESFGAKRHPKIENGGGFKNVQCSVCDKTFSRTDHLKRHQLRHSGIKPYSCIFCKDSFTRSDNLREHYPTCPERGLREIPDGGRRGRRPHACDSCTSVKLGCDGNSPCKTCRAKKIECKYSRLQNNGPPKRSDASKPIQDSTQSTDIGSIKFLLNHGTASFIECFRFPPNGERCNTLDSIMSTQDSESIHLATFGNGSDNGSNLSDPFEEDSIDISVFDDENLIRFLNSPFNNVQNQSDDLFASMFMDPTFASFAPMANVAVARQPVEWEPATLQSGAMVQAILDKAYALQLDAQELAVISENLNFLFIPSRIEKLVRLYFETWHRHCPILHQPSFDIGTIPTPLLLSVTLLGAMYSQDEREASTAKALLDISELYVYSMEGLTEESEVLQMLRMGNSITRASAKLSPLAFLYLQGAYLMICAQFWGGNRLARRRAIELRFGVVVKMARTLGLTKEKHELHDSIDEYSWIQKETRIRTMSIMTLLDCAFCFFANYPCRLALSEMQYDLPCDEEIFACPHPFSEPGFHPSRHLTTLEAFQSLFGRGKSSIQSRHGNNDGNNDKSNPLELNVLDMFILIHLLYVHTQVHITLFSSSFPRSSASSTFDANIMQTKTALIRWRTLWHVVRSKISQHTWASLGFYKNAYNYFLVTQLLINNKSSPDIMMGMEINCEDTLTHLRSLLREPGNEKPR